MLTICSHVCGCMYVYVCVCVCSCVCTCVYVAYVSTRVYVCVRSARGRSVMLVVWHVPHVL